MKPNHALVQTILPMYTADQLISLGGFGNRMGLLGVIGGPL
jgi:hypothetical protein